MLKLHNITKNYEMGDFTVNALCGVDVEFGKNEFVAILGPSGCGKTTLLNIIGGLDGYTGGDLEINGVSTKKFRDSDWDTYRNHSIGFVFQSYNLIEHQSVLSNVELALTLTGVPRAQRRKRAIEVLEQVGLKDQINKKPTQMSGGQMQRVAIARALINNPDILLADEPTGALDSQTSEQIMEILKEIAQEKLVIMVTHNPQLAEKYATRTIKLLDGRITDDSNPYTAPKTPSAKAEKRRGKKPSMSFFTALSLSLNNLLTKKTRTFMTSFAGSIGIIGIALILSLSTGFQVYIDRVQKDTLSGYPLTIQRESVDYSSMMTSFMGETESAGEHGRDKVYSNNFMNEMTDSMLSEVRTNDLKSFKKYLESGKTDIDEYVSDIQYSYDLDLQVYSQDTSSGVVQVNPNKIFEKLYGETYSQMASSMTDSAFDVWDEMLGNKKLMREQYDVIAGDWPEKYNEVVLLVNENNEISDMALYSLGLMDQGDLEDMVSAVLDGKEYKAPETVSFSYDELLDTKFKLVLNTDYFTFDKDKDCWLDNRDDKKFMKRLVKNAVDINIVGILRPSDGTVATALTGAIGYTHALTDFVADGINNSKIVKQQKADRKTDVFTGIRFNSGNSGAAVTMDDVTAYIASLPEDEQAQTNAYIANMSEKQIIEMFSSQLKPKTTENTYKSNLATLGVINLAEPSAINIYPVDFESKDKIEGIIEDFNDTLDEDKEKISYTDYIGILMSSVSTIINVISYVLIAFVSISLVVSSIMIGIITYISVLERTKEIGILRAIGASKRDISRVFNAETLIIGLVSGLLGIGLTVLLNIPINIVISHFTDIPNVAGLPVAGGVILVIISMALSLIAGLIPSRIAARKDPVEALRSE